MKHINRLCVLTASLMFCAVAASGQTALGPGFTYQGKLLNGATPVDGTVNLVFRLYNANAAGSLLGTQTLNSTTVTGGLFTVQLNSNNEFGGNPFNGQAFWLDISVNGTPLTPRQPLTAAPYALGLRLPLSETVATGSAAINIVNTRRIFGEWLLRRCRQ